MYMRQFACKLQYIAENRIFGLEEIAISRSSTLKNNKGKPLQLPFTIIKNQLLFFGTLMNLNLLYRLWFSFLFFRYCHF